MKTIKLYTNSNFPKYKQIIKGVENAILNGKLKKGDKLPSLNIIKETNKLSRDTVLTAFNELKNRGIIYSVVGKGYYVSTENIEVKKKVFLLFDELNAFKEDLYNAFLENLDDNIQVDIYFHHFNKTTFQKLINDNIGNYTYYIIMPANIENAKNTIQQLPKEKVFILDQTQANLEEYSSIYQDFEKDIQKGLFTGLHAIRKYKKLILIFSKNKQPQGLLNGFLSFCNQYNINNEVITSIHKKEINKGDLFITLDDNHLIKIIKSIQEQKLNIAQDVGIISYNDTLLKEVVANGITTISTDFKHMGKQLSEMILKNEHTVIANPSKLIFRKSI